MQEHIQLVLLELKRQKKAESFPDHIFAQANRVICSASSICENANIMKYSSDGKSHAYIPYLKQSIISTMSCCLRMLEEMEK